MKDKWKTLKHKGPIFPPEYEYQKFNVIVDGKKYTLSPETEEMAYAWAQKHATDYVKDSVFQKNFWKDFSAVIPSELKKTRFPNDWDFSEIVYYIERKKEEKKNRSKEEKKAEKQEKARIKEEYGFAELDGEIVPLGNYTVEPPGLFMGRGKHPKRGRWKKRVYPEDITINHSFNLDPPKAPEGHEWKEVVENKNALYIAVWTQELTGDPKKVLFGAASSVKQESDKKKFEKAKKLARKLEWVVEQVENNLTSNDANRRKAATAAYLIAKLAIRVGDEKDEDTADTVGATSLRKEHVTIDKNLVTFDFLGKDSIRYNNTVELHPDAVANLQELLDNRKLDERIFDNISSFDVNEFFKSILDGVTAKQFRTAYGSRMLAEELAKIEVSSEDSPFKKLEAFTYANLTVAHKLNHHSAVSEAQKRSLNNMKDRLKRYKEELKQKKQEMKEELAAAKEMKDARLEKAATYKGDRKKEAKRRAKEAYENKVGVWDRKINRLEERIQGLETKIRLKKETEGVALGTSKTNYADPRIAYSYAKSKNLDIKKIFTPTLQAKFEWAADVDDDYHVKYPNVD